MQRGTTEQDLTNMFGRAYKKMEEDGVIKPAPIIVKNVCSIGIKQWCYVASAVIILSAVTTCIVVRCIFA